MKQTSRTPTKSATFKDIADTFPKKKPEQPVSIEDMTRAVAQGAVRQFKKAVAENRPL